jgi:hypothetical protein
VDASVCLPLLVQNHSCDQRLARSDSDGPHIAGDVWKAHSAARTPSPLPVDDAIAIAILLDLEWLQHAKDADRVAKTREFLLPFIDVTVPGIGSDAID